VEPEFIQVPSGRIGVPARSRTGKSGGPLDTKAAEPAGRGAKVRVPESAVGPELPRKARGRSASVAAEQIAPPPKRTAVSVGPGRASKDKGLAGEIAADLPKARRAGLARTRVR